MYELVSRSRIVAGWMTVAAIGCLGSVRAQSVISGDGIIESTTGGFKFPDGTVQTTAAGANPCARPDPSDEMVEVGGVCIDKYEASVWDAPVGGSQIVGRSPTDYCSPNGQDCDDIYARSVAGVEPAAYITWFQAQQALANSGKRLPTNAEWQVAVAGTPDPGASPGSEDCHVGSAPPSREATGERSNCISRWGVHDMVGNLMEWVADWDEDAGTPCTTWPSGFGADGSCFGRADGLTTSSRPGALLRGGAWYNGDWAGPFTVAATEEPVEAEDYIGFRGAR